MRKDTRTVLVVVSILLTLTSLLSSAAFLLQVPVGAQLSANLQASYVQGSIDLQNPGTEGFWSQMTGADIPLAGSNGFGGSTKSILVKMANNGTDLLVYATWADPTESRLKNDVIEDPAFPGLFMANSTFSYEDRIVFWWSLDQSVGPPPCMQKSAYGHGEGESLAGTGNLWHWKAARTDTLGTSFGKLKYGSGPNTGQPLVPPHSYADNEFINTTGHYQLGWDQYPTKRVPGNFTIGEGENNVPYGTFVVSAHGVYDSSSHMWKWAAARSLTTTPTLHTQQFAAGKMYYFAVGVFDGGPIPIPQGVQHPAGWTMYGENEETKSISSWFTMALSSGAATSTATSASFASIVSYRVDQAPDYSLPGKEPFWDAISWTNVPLAGSVSPGGGHTTNVLVKSANDGYNIYVLFRWNDSVGPSFGSESEAYLAPNGTLLPLNPEDTGRVNQLFYNSTYYYQDRAAILWFLQNSIQRQQSPVMVLGSSGALTGGAAEIWHWQSVPTDNSPNDSDFPGGYTDPSGSPIFPADNVSFAEDDYTNTTGFYVIGGSFGAGAPNLDQYADPYIVHVGSHFSDSDKTWTVEMVRSFTTSQATQYTEQLATGASYYVAFAIWNGKLGESAHIKSVSQWYNLTVSDQTQLPPTTTTTTSPEAGVGTPLVAATGIGLLIVGIIIGLTVRPRPKENKK